MKKVRFLGLDVHAETIAVAVSDDAGEAQTLGIIPNREEAVRKLVKKLGPAEQLRACYEAGPTGYVLYWQLTALGVKCEVVAPTLIPVRAGDRVKTDRRDARKLAECYRAGVLTAVWVPDADTEGLRDLVRAREAAKQDQLRARHRLGKFLLRQGRRMAGTGKPWTQAYLRWVREVSFEQAAQQATLEDYLNEVERMAERVLRLEAKIRAAVSAAPAPLQELVAGLAALRGIAEISAVTLASELGQISRFRSPRQLMAYSGMVSREDSSGQRQRRGAITKTGNAHLRRIVGEAAWAYRHKPRIGPVLRQRQARTAAPVAEIAWKAQQRLHKRYCALTGKGKERRKVITALGRELLGFIWAIGVQVETGQPPRSASAAAKNP